jgi:hypothetical protein
MMEYVKEFVDCKVIESVQQRTDKVIIARTAKVEEMEAAVAAVAQREVIKMIVADMLTAVAMKEAAAAQVEAAAAQVEHAWQRKKAAAAQVEHAWQQKKEQEEQARHQKEEQGQAPKT